LRLTTLIVSSFIDLLVLFQVGGDMPFILLKTHEELLASGWEHVEGYYELPGNRSDANVICDHMLDHLGKVVSVEGPNPASNTRYRDSHGYGYSPWMIKAEGQTQAEVLGKIKPKSKRNLPAWF
jgi:hypothetical protein